MIHLETARQLLDYHGDGDRISAGAAEKQLRGAVAVHNILERERVAYLADEVGMGKTFVALGAIALFRHFDPTFRVLVIAPRENIQRKWMLTERGNFVKRVVKFPDLRVKAIGGRPARPAVLCANLVELVREATVAPDRDFFLRMTSFSLGLGADARDWRGKRDELVTHLPHLETSDFDLRSKDTFKEAFARGVCCALPTFDLVVVDEAHNLKHGIGPNVAARNRVLGLVFGHPSGVVSDRGFRAYQPRARRVLFLSATPIETDYLQLWNQLEVFGFGSRFPELRDAAESPGRKRDCARRILIRRVAGIHAGADVLTKNLYRREWRSGGVSTHDEPLTVTDERQQLIVALVQKKVSELLGSTRFNHSFQIGMLSSFESFLETTKVRSKDAEEDRQGTFDDAEQTDDAVERDGIDVRAVNGIAASYRRTFGTEMPHPKMDAVVDKLQSALDNGRKALVFVRRVASVRELKRKLDERYDRRILDRLEADLVPEVWAELRPHVERYEEERLARRRATAPVQSPPPFTDSEEPDETMVSEETDKGDTDTFFAWFFRGDRQRGVLSGSALAQRFMNAGTTLSTFFEDNHLAWLLGEPPEQVPAALAAALGWSAEALARELRARAAPLLPLDSRHRRRNLFLAFQQAAIGLVAQHPGRLRDRAEIVRLERYASAPPSRASSLDVPDPSEWLCTRTFWTELRDRTALRDTLWPTATRGTPRAHFREQELRRELLSAMVRLGNPLIDLYVLAVNRIGGLGRGAREENADDTLGVAREYLNLLEGQSQSSDDRFTTFGELAAAARHFDLVLDVNAPRVRDTELTEVTRAFGQLLRAQQPVAGMWGEVNRSLVQQFRMPGYPLVLVTTELLQEGEDLHTFCSDIHHYGISWTPSSMEQRVGRIDRVSSQTERRLVALGRAPSGEEKLQVFYPHLRETVERLQVRKVLDRIQVFLEAMHEDLGTPHLGSGQLDVATALLDPEVVDGPTQEVPLRSAFEEQESDVLVGHPTPLAVPDSVALALEQRLRQLRMAPFGDLDVEWTEQTRPDQLVGHARLADRQQPFVLRLLTSCGAPMVRCESPVGPVNVRANAAALDGLSRGTRARVCVRSDDKRDEDEVYLQGDVLLPLMEDACDVSRVEPVMRDVIMVADRLELELLGCDAVATADELERLTEEDANAT